jgi:hypothetical protein
MKNAPLLVAFSLLTSLIPFGTAAAQGLVPSERGYLITLTEPTLCAAYHFDPSNEDLIKAIERRNLLNKVDKDVLSKYVPILGMSECGMFALSGFPEKISLHYQDNPYEKIFHPVAYFYKMADHQSILVVGVDKGIVDYLHGTIE